MQIPRQEEGILALREFHAPFGIPDLTVVVGDHSLRRRRLRLSVPPLVNEIDAGVVSVVNAVRPSSADQISARVGWPISTVRRRIPGLIRVGALVETAPDRFVRRKEIVPIGTTWAIETKVSEWRRALRQCRTYRTWADGYILIMGRVPSTSLSVLRREVTNDRGGLVIGDDWIVHPRTTKLPSARRLWTSEHIVAACKRPTSSLPPPRRR